MISCAPFGIDSITLGTMKIAPSTSSFESPALPKRMPSSGSSLSRGKPPVVCLCDRVRMPDSTIDWPSLSDTSVESFETLRPGRSVPAATGGVRSITSAASLTSSSRSVGSYRGSTVTSVPNRIWVSEAESPEATT